MADEHGDGFFGSETKKSKRLIIEQAIAQAYAAGRYSAAHENLSPKPVEYAKKKMAELEKKLEGRPW